MDEIDRRDEADARAAAVGHDDQSDEANSQSQFELYTDKGGETRWRLRHNNGNIIADCAEGYSSRRSAMQGLRAVQRDAVEATVQDLDKMDEGDGEVLVGEGDQSDGVSSQSQFELYTDKGGETRWRLRHNNGNIIADCAEGYSSRQSAMQGLHAVQRDAVEATVQDLDEMDEGESNDEVLVGDDEGE